MDCEGKAKCQKISATTYEMIHIADLALLMLFVITFLDGGKVVIGNYVNHENFIFSLLNYII